MLIIRIYVYKMYVNNTLIQSIMRSFAVHRRYTIPTFSRNSTFWHKHSILSPYLIKLETIEVVDGVCRGAANDVAVSRIILSGHELELDTEWTGDRVV